MCVWWKKKVEQMRLTAMVLQEWAVVNWLLLDPEIVQWVRLVRRKRP